MNEKVLRRAIVVSWVVLVACFVIKVFGGNWFEVIITNPKILAAGTYLDTHAWVVIVIFTVTSYTLFNLYYLAICQKTHFKWYIHVALIPYFFGITAAKFFVDPKYRMALDLVTLFIVPYILLLKPPYKYFFKPRGEHFTIVIAFVLNFGFQAISMTVKNISIDLVVQESFITELILTLDIYIMMALYYFYRRRMKIMSLAFCLLLGKGKEELNSMLSDVNKKLAANPGKANLLEEKAAIEAEIAKCEER